MAEKTDKRGRDTLLSFIYPLTEADMTAEQRDQFELAVHEQLDFMDSAEGSKNTAVKVESVGDVSVTYADTWTHSVGGCRISPKAYNRLMRCGLLTRWF